MRTSTIAIFSFIALMDGATAAEWPSQLDRMTFDMRNATDQGRAASIIVAAQSVCQGAVSTDGLNVSADASASEMASKGMAEGRALALQAVDADPKRLCRWIIERFGRHGSVFPDLRVRRMSDAVLGDHWAGLSRERRREFAERNETDGRTREGNAKGIISDVLACTDWMTGGFAGADRDDVLLARSTPLEDVVVSCRTRVARKEMPWKRK